jgi:hypothetical protein
VDVGEQAAAARGAEPAEGDVGAGRERLRAAIEERDDGATVGAGDDPVAFGERLAVDGFARPVFAVGLKLDIAADDGEHSARRPGARRVEEREAEDDAGRRERANGDHGEENGAGSPAHRQPSPGFTQARGRAAAGSVGEPL